MSSSQLRNNDAMGTEEGKEWSSGVLSHDEMALDPNLNRMTVTTLPSCKLRLRVVKINIMFTKMEVVLYRHIN